MPQTVDRIDFACTDVDPSQWPKLSCGGNEQLLLQTGGLRLEADREVLFADNGQLRCFDDNHRLVFNRAGNQLELHEAGDILFLTGVPALTEKLRIRADGNVGVGTAAPGAKLHVAGTIQAEGNLRVAGDATLDANLSVAGTANLGGNMQVQGNLQVSGLIDAAAVLQNGAGIVSSQWSSIAGGINFAGGNVGVGDATPGERLDVAGRIKAGALTIGSWPASAAFVFFGTNALEQGQAGNYALLQDTTGTDIGRTFLNSPKQIHFRINNSDRMFLANNGNVGIGTISPAVKLQIVGGTDAETTNQGGFLVIGNLNGANLAMDDNEILARNNAQKSTLNFQPNGGDIWVHSKQNGTDFMIKDNGFVGVGTSNPSTFIHVRGARPVMERAGSMPLALSTRKT